MFDIYKVIVFLFVVVLLIYMIRLRLLAMAKLDLKTPTFTILLIGLSFCTVATFLDMIFPFWDSKIIYILLRVCFTLGAIFYIIGVILWSNYTKTVIQRYEEMALKDSMTDVFNRNGMEKVYKSVLQTNDKFFIIVGDLDRLKKINDEYGHLEGDRYIANASKIISKTLNGQGYVGRIGGDEFVILLNNKDLNEVEQIMTSIRQSIFQVSPGKSTGISLGYSVFPEEGSSLEDLVSVADRRMYIEKKSKKYQ